MKNDRLPQGLIEFSLEDSKRHQELTSKLFNVLIKEGFSKIEPSQVDFAKNLEMERNSSDLLFKSIDSDGKLLAFAGDITPSIMRLLDGETQIKRVYFDRPNYSFRQLSNGSRVSQECGAQIYGIKDAEGDAEIISASFDSLRLNGVEKVKIVLGHSFLFKSIIYSYKPTEGITTEDIRVLVETGKCDKLSDVCVGVVTTLARQKGDINVLQQVAEGINNREAIDCLLRLFEIYQILAEYELEDMIEFDFGYMPSAPYYNGMIFKIESDDKVLVEGGNFTGSKYTSLVTATSFKYNLSSIMSIIDTDTSKDDSNVVLGVANGVASLNKARKIKLSLMESNVQIHTLYKVTKEECRSIAVQLGVQNIIYINDKGELEE